MLIAIHPTTYRSGGFLAHGVLKINKMAKVNELAKINKVSVDTVRRDLEVLEGYGILERVRGGAVWKDANNTRNIYEVRVTVNTEKKKKLQALQTECWPKVRLL